MKLTQEFLRKAIYWIVCKYMMDDFKREQSSSKRALLGGFIDRWMNKAPEFLIFDELLKNKDYSIVTDTFFYNAVSLIFHHYFFKIFSLFIFV